VPPLLARGAEGSDTTGDGIFDMKSKSSTSPAPPDDGAGGGPIGCGLAVFGLRLVEAGLVGDRSDTRD
jgi:hypothetical protein